MQREVLWSDLDSVKIQYKALPILAEDDKMAELTLGYLSLCAVFPLIV